jgi:hypothetical protein
MQAYKEALNRFGYMQINQTDVRNVMKLDKDRCTVTSDFYFVLVNAFV